MLDTQKLAQFARHVEMKQLVATRPASFAAYIATSACRIRSSLVQGPPPCTTTPMLAASTSSRPSDRHRLGESARATVRATAMALVSLAPRAATRTRPAESSERVVGRDLVEAARDLLQQPVAGVVSEAVVDLLEPVEVDDQHCESSLDRSERTRAWSSRSRKSARFARRVRPSWNAWRVSSSSSRTRSVTSRALSTTPRTCRSSRRSVTCASRWRHSPNLFAHPEHELVRLPHSRRLAPALIVGVDEADEAPTEHVLLACGRACRAPTGSRSGTPSPKTSTRSVEDVTRLRKCAV